MSTCGVLLSFATIPIIWKKMRYLIVYQSLSQNLTMIKLFYSTWIRIYKIYILSLTKWINMQRYKSSKFLPFYDIITACNTIFY